MRCVRHPINLHLNPENLHEFASVDGVRSSGERSLSSKRNRVEMARILEDMKQFREKANWTAVEKRYQQLSNFSKAEPTVEMYLLGAEASRNLGDVTAMKTRLTKALAMKETDRFVNGMIRLPQHTHLSQSNSPSWKRYQN